MFRLEAYVSVAGLLGLTVAHLSGLVRHAVSVMVSTRQARARMGSSVDSEELDGVHDRRVAGNPAVTAGPKSVFRWHDDQSLATFGHPEHSVRETNGRARAQIERI